MVVHTYISIKNVQNAKLCSFLGFDFFFFFTPWANTLIFTGYHSLSEQLLYESLLSPVGFQRMNEFFKTEEKRVFYELNAEKQTSRLQGCLQ